MGHEAIPLDHKNVITEHGEHIEKVWRQKLYEKAITVEQQEAPFNVVLMKGAAHSEGLVDIFYGTDDSLSQATLTEALNEAVKQANQELETRYEAGEVRESF